MRTVGFVLLVLVSSTASAERPRGVYVPVSPPPESIAAAGQYTIFMNRHGGVYRGANWDDAGSNKTGIVDGTVQISAYPYDDHAWSEVMQCMRELYAPFRVTITDVDPGPVPHIESIIATDPAEIGQPRYVGGIAPFACQPIQGAIVFTFAGVWGNDPRAHCETAAQETAHAFGLDHEFLCQDPMTYLTGCGEKRFRNVDAPCGEYNARACQCGGQTQNSVRVLSEVLGSTTFTPPTVAILQPANGSVVQRGFRIQAAADDDVGVDRVDLFIDGVSILTDTEEPFEFTAPMDLPVGDHQIKVVAYNLGDLTAEHTVIVHLEPACESDDACQGDDVCAGGQCLPPPTEAGGLGTFCGAEAPCFNGACATNDGESRCSAICDPSTPNSCPAGFDCLQADSGGLCWPSSEVGWCTVGAGRKGAPAFALPLLGLAFIMLRLRRRRMR